MKRKLFLLSLVLVLAIFLSGCSGGGIVTPDPDGVGGDFYVCENLLKGFYIALSNQNFTQALSYCKSGGIMFKFTNSRWEAALEYPTTYFTYQIYDIYNFSYVGKYVSLYYDYSWTQHYIYGVYSTDYKYGALMLFEKVNGEWKMA
jgi:hypothetical protein